MISIKKRPIAIAVFVVSTAFSASSHALDSKMGDMIEDAASSAADELGVGSVQTVDPSHRGTAGQRRGVASGGSVRLRFDRSGYDPDLVSFEAPSFEMGCGGLDAHGGGLSWISGEEMREALNQLIGPQVAMQAAMIALNQVSQDLAQIVSNFQTWLNEFNNFLKTDCETTAAALMDPDETPQEKMAAVGEGIQDHASKASQMWTSDDDAEVEQSDSTEDCIEDEDCEDDLLGNAVWDYMEEEDVEGWMAGLDDGEAYREFLMSFSGTQIREMPEDGQDQEDMEITDVAPDPPSFEDFIRGTSLTGLKCESEDCRQTSTGEEIIDLDDPLEEQILDMVDPANEDSLIYKFSIHYDGIELEDDQKQFIQAVSSQVPIAKHARTAALTEGELPASIASGLATQMSILVVEAIVEDAWRIARSVTSDLPENSDKLRRNAKETHENYKREIANYREENRSTLKRVTSQLESL